MKLFEIEKDGDITRKWYADENGNAFKETIQDIAPALAQARIARDMGGKGKDMRHVATIPTVLLDKWKKEEGLDFNNPDDWIKIVAKLNSPEYHLLRVHEGRI